MIVASNINAVREGITNETGGYTSPDLNLTANYDVNYIIYVSCKPTSLARDLEIFQQNGYMMSRAVAVDQFPWTSHVETVVLLTKTSGSEG